MRYLFTLLAIALLAACNTNSSNAPAAKNDSDTAASTVPVSETRENPQSAPVANYEKKVQSDLNNWFFKVQLYETKQRFTYRLAMEYEAIHEEQEIRFPNLNIEPKPEIRSGNKDYEAIIGFQDQQGQFREFLKVFVEEGNLRIKQLKYYAVTATPKQ